MTIETNDEITIKAEIKAALFMRAFEALAMEVGRRDPKTLNTTARPVLETLQNFSVKGFDGGPKSTLSSPAIRKAQEEGHQAAFESVKMVLGRLSKFGTGR